MSVYWLDEIPPSVSVCQHILSEQVYFWDTHYMLLGGESNQDTTTAIPVVVKGDVKTNFPVVVKGDVKTNLHCTADQLLRSVMVSRWWGGWDVVCPLHSHVSHLKPCTSLSMVFVHFYLWVDNRNILVCEISACCFMNVKTLTSIFVHALPARAFFSFKLALLLWKIRNVMYEVFVCWTV